jgi:hypothetical protein
MLNVGWTFASSYAILRVFHVEIWLNVCKICLDNLGKSCFSMMNVSWTFASSNAVLRVFHVERWLNICSQQCSPMCFSCWNLVERLQAAMQSYVFSSSTYGWTFATSNAILRVFHVDIWLNVCRQQCRPTCFPCWTLVERLLTAMLSYLFSMLKFVKRVQAAMQSYVLSMLKCGWTFAGSNAALRGVWECKRHTVDPGNDQSWRSLAAQRQRVPSLARVSHNLLAAPWIPAPQKWINH